MSSQGQTTPSNSDLQFNFEGDFQEKYKRNNKKGGRKNLRCFPCCGENHNDSIACEVPIVVCHLVPNNIPLPKDTTFFAFARFLSELELENDFQLGTEVKTEYLASKTRTDKKPLNSLYKGDLVHELNRCRQFEFKEKGWHYGWRGGRYKTNLQHYFVTYVFASCKDKDGEFLWDDDDPKMSKGSCRCLGRLSSKPFSIFSSRSVKSRTSPVKNEPKEETILNEMNIDQLNTKQTVHQVVDHVSTCNGRLHAVPMPTDNGNLRPLDAVPVPINDETSRPLHEIRAPTNNGIARPRQKVRALTNNNGISRYFLEVSAPTNNAISRSFLEVSAPTINGMSIPPHAVPFEPNSWTYERRQEVHGSAQDAPSFENVTNSEVATSDHFCQPRSHWGQELVPHHSDEVPGTGYAVLRGTLDLNNALLETPHRGGTGARPAYVGDEAIPVSAGCTPSTTSGASSSTSSQELEPVEGFHPDFESASNAQASNDGFLSEDWCAPYEPALFGGYLRQAPAGPRYLDQNNGGRLKRRREFSQSDVVLYRAGIRTPSSGQASGATHFWEQGPSLEGARECGSASDKSSDGPFASLGLEHEVSTSGDECSISSEEVEPWSCDPESAVVLNGLVEREEAQEEVGTGEGKDGVTSPLGDSGTDVTRDELVEETQGEALQLRSEDEATRWVKSEDINVVRDELVESTQGEVLKLRSEDEAMRLAKSEDINVVRDELVESARAEALKLRSEDEAMRLAKSEDINVVRDDLEEDAKVETLKLRSEDEVTRQTQSQDESEEAHPCSRETGESFAPSDSGVRYLQHSPDDGALPSDREEEQNREGGATVPMAEMLALDTQGDKNLVTNMCCFSNKWTLGLKVLLAYCGVVTAAAASVLLATSGPRLPRISEFLPESCIDPEGGHDNSDITFLSIAQIQALPEYFLDEYFDYFSKLNSNKPKCIEEYTSLFDLAKRYTLDVQIMHYMVVMIAVHIVIFGVAFVVLSLQQHYRLKYGVLQHPDGEDEMDEYDVFWDFALNGDTRLYDEMEEGSQPVVQSEQRDCAANVSRPEVPENQIQDI